MTSDNQPASVLSWRRTQLLAADEGEMRDTENASSATPPTVLRVRDLKVEFSSVHGGEPRRAVRGVNFSVAEGGSLAILGESGSGKTVTGRALMGLVECPPGRVSGSVEYDGMDLVGASESEMEGVRGKGIAMVFQDSLDSLNPVFSVGSQLTEIFRVRLGWSRRAARDEAVKLMTQVGIASAADRLGNYPHQFSGGMRQRICIAMAIALRPRILIADEPTTALDVTVQAGILRLIRDLQREAQMSLIFITHDLSVARTVATRVAVMYAGKIVEEGPIDEIYQRPSHPYTRALMQSQPDAVTEWSQLRPISGNPPDSDTVIPGCSFNPRCVMAQDRCRVEEPELRQITGSRVSRCHFAEDVMGAERIPDAL
jgi:oligopeptide/dipeptide ABC transporter ATP-binding protein